MHIEKSKTTLAETRGTSFVASLLRKFRPYCLVRALRLFTQSLASLVAISLLLQSPCSTSWATSQFSGAEKGWFKDLEAEWGGHLKLQGSLSRIEEETIFQPGGTKTYDDGNAEGRLKNKLFLGNWGDLEIHYEIVRLGGDTWTQSRELERLFPDLSKAGIFTTRPVDDDRRLMDLTKIISEDDNHILYHRLDRLSLTLRPPWGFVRVGRQAITWGNGLLFNPMDLFNPFSPTDIQRDYKFGDDMFFVQIPFRGTGNAQFLFIPRRVPSTGSLEMDQSSMAGKLHLAVNTTEIDFMAAKHFEDHLLGLGSSGYLGNTAWRIDITWTALDEESPSESYLSVVANMDYSWAWWKKNFYGFVEFFYSGIGSSDYGMALGNPDIRKRLDRGELFVLGNFYLSGLIQVELHPLLNVFLTSINNVKDHSGILQPRAVWDMARDIQITFGANIHYGVAGTEFGGFTLPDTPFMIEPSNSVYLLLSYYF